MQDEAQADRKYGAVAVLALLLSVLFSAAQVPAGRFGGEPGTSSIGRSDSSKSGIAPRIAARNHDHEREGDGPPPGAAGARIETFIWAVRNIPAAEGVRSLARTAERVAFYRARGPPAAT